VRAAAQGGGEGGGTPRRLGLEVGPEFQKISANALIPAEACEQKGCGVVSAGIGRSQQGCSAVGTQVLLGQEFAQVRQRAIRDYLLEYLGGRTGGVLAERVRRCAAAALTLAAKSLVDSG
jgi:hypothetical protein